MWRLSWSQKWNEIRPWHVFSPECVNICAAKSSVLNHSMTFKMPGTKVHSADNWPIFQDNDNGEAEMDIVC